MRLKNIWYHFHTITKHRHMVIKHCFKAGIGLQGLFHDLSKYSPVEFSAGVKHFQGNRSPNEVERELNGYSPAWLHHKGRNKHHFEYWTDYHPTTRIVSPVKMPLNYVIEMFCDRVAASKIYKKADYTDSSSLEYFLNSKSRRSIHPETSELIEGLLTMLRDFGENATFSHIRNMLNS